MAKNQVSIKDVQEALKASPVSTEAGFAGGEVKSVGPQKILPLKNEIKDLTGKKLKRDVSVFRNGKEFSFKKGTAWEAIAEQYKTGLGRVNFSAEDFE